MPKNKGAGGKNRRKGKNFLNEKKEMVYKDIDQEYGQVIKPIGSGHMEVMCFTTNGNVTKRAHIRGKMRKRVWVATGDIVLLSIRDYQSDVCDILLKYTSDEARILRTRHLIPDGIDINKKDMATDDDFEYENDEEIEVSDDETKHIGHKMIADQNRNYELPSSDSDSDTDNELDNL